MPPEQDRVRRVLEVLVARAGGYLRAGEPVVATRAFQPELYVVDELGGNDHVLLLEDTWTTGSHLQSASAALNEAGAAWVTGLVLSRWLDPDRGQTRELIRDLEKDFDPLICPFTGRRCGR